MKGATLDSVSFVVSDSISIHAPVKGATVILSDYGRPIVDFNPRSREGSDVAVFYCCNSVAISIHAPVKGATNESTGYDGLGKKFQSTLP